MECKGTILFVDDLIDAPGHDLTSMVEEITDRGYAIFKAANVEDAHDCLRQIPIDLIISDVRLESTSENVADRSGIDLVLDYPHIARIIVSGFQWDYDALLDLPADVQIVRKNYADSDEELLFKIARAFRDVVPGANDGLEIRDDGQLFHFIQRIAEHREKPVAEIEDLRLELVDELLRRLFLEEKVIRVGNLLPGRGGSGVMAVQPIYEDDEEGASLVVKFGTPKDIRQEHENYREHVEKFVGKSSTQLVGEMVVARNFAGLKYLFVGSADGAENDAIHFDEKYRHSSPEEVAKIVENIFLDACKLWYDGNQDWDYENARHLDVLTHYRDQLGLFGKRLERIMGIKEAILDGRLGEGVWFKRCDEDESLLQMKVGRYGAWEKYPDPLRFLETADSWPDILKQPSNWCRTHGDLNARNIFVGKNDTVWLIDFFHTGWGPALRDVAMLETVIKFEMLEVASFVDAKAIEDYLLAPHLVSENIERPLINNGPETQQRIEKAFAAITKLRQIARAITPELAHDATEYYLNLYFYAVKMIKGFSSLDPTDRRLALRRRHALYSAACLADKLQKKIAKYEEA